MYIYQNYSIIYIFTKISTNRYFHSYKEYKESLVYTNQNYDEEFQWPSKLYTLNISEIKKIKHHFSVIEDQGCEKFDYNQFLTNSNSSVIGLILRQNSAILYMIS